MPGEQQAAILDNQRTSYVGHTIPDPALMTQTMNRFNAIEKDRMNLTVRQDPGGMGVGLGTQSPMIAGGVAGEWRRRSQAPPADPYGRTQNF